MLQRPENLNWVTPQWWVPLNRGEIPISRNVLIEHWKKQVGQRPPRPNNLRVFRDQLRAWCSAAGKAKAAGEDKQHWISKQYTPAATKRLWDNGKGVYMDAEVWDNVSSVMADYVDAFARYSCTFQEDAVAYRSDALPREIQIQLPGEDTPRSPFERVSGYTQSQAVTAAAKAMINGSGRVLDSAANADRFLRDPSVFRLEIRSAALRRFGEELLVLAARYDDEVLFGDSTKELVEQLRIGASDIEDEFGDLTKPSRRPTPEEEAQVKAYLIKAIPAWLSADRPRLQTPEDGQVKKDPVERIPKRLMSGRPTTSDHSIERENFIYDNMFDRTNRSVVKLLVEDAIVFVEEKKARGQKVEMKLSTKHEEAAKARCYGHWTYAGWDYDRDRRNEWKRSVQERSIEASKEAFGWEPEDNTEASTSLAANLRMTLGAALAYLQDTPDNELRAAVPGYAGPEPSWEKQIAIDVLSERSELSAEKFAQSQGPGGMLPKLVAARREADAPTDAMAPTAEESVQIIKVMIAEAMSTSGQVHGGSTWNTRIAKIMKKIDGRATTTTTTTTTTRIEQP